MADLRINFESIKPIYLQVAEAIEDDIILGRLKDGDPVYSQLVLARELNINPATAAKGINLLVQKGILIKQRGLSMLVAGGAKERLTDEKLEKEFAGTMRQLVEQANKIGLSKKQVLEKLNSAFSETIVN
ncbi:MAG: GntR family transcriptional regulator [Clostridiales bacterium]|nr:GntR family transcriptional regulator [Clostridiales bacterium]